MTAYRHKVDRVEEFRRRDNRVEVRSILSLSHPHDRWSPWRTYLEYTTREQADAVITRIATSDNGGWGHPWTMAY